MNGQTMTAPANPFTGAGWTGWKSAAAVEMAARDYRAGNRAAAARRCRDILAGDGWHFDAAHLLGVVCLELEQFDDAVTYLDRAACVRPDAATVLLNLGNAQMGMARHAAALAAFRRAVAALPGNIDALNNMGNALAALHRHDEAIECLHQALAIRPGHPPALFNLGKRLAELGRLAEAEDSFRSALKSLGPQGDRARLTDIHCELGRVLMDLGRPEEALAETRAMLALNTDPGGAKWHESLVLLTLGRYAEGWEKYEYRYSVKDRTPPHPAARLLDLAEVPGKRILVCGEQGFGDTIQFARYARLLARAGAAVSLCVYPELKRLLRAMDYVAFVTEPGEEQPPVDLVTALPSLPLTFHTELASIPAHVPYLHAPEQDLAAWRERLGPRQQPRLGICWSGNQNMPQRSMPLAALAPLLERTDLELHIVQKELTPPDRDCLAAYPTVRYHGEAHADFADTAALLSLMDLVITIDTAVAHLAGALARPVWILLPFSADWRWLRDRTDSPWYPTARLFRQPEFGDWAAVVAAVTRALATYDFVEPHDA